MVNFHSESQNILTKSESKIELQCGRTEKNLISSNNIVSNLPKSNDPDPKPRYVYVLEKIGEYINSISPDNSKGVQVKPLISIDKKTNGNVEPQTYRLIELILGS